jgi:hypothetical protein
MIGYLFIIIYGQVQCNRVIALKSLIIIVKDCAIIHKFFKDVLMRLQLILSKWIGGLMIQEFALKE